MHETMPRKMPIVVPKEENDGDFLHALMPRMSVRGGRKRRSASLFTKSIAALNALRRSSAVR